MAFVELISLSRCKEDAGTFVNHEGRRLAVFWLVESGQVFVIDDECPHAGGSLAAGDVAGRTVTCPWHHWEFELETGACATSPKAEIQRYPAEIRNGMVWADLPEVR